MRSPARNVIAATATKLRCFMQYCSVRYADSSWSSNPLE